MKKILIILLAILCLAPAVYANEPTEEKLTKDFTCSAWALPYAKQADELGIIPGILQGADLTQPITRKEFASLSTLLYENISRVKAEISEDLFFTDCDDNEVLKAATLGITAGIGNGRFAPESLLTREQAATMLSRIYKKISLENWNIEHDEDFEHQFIMGFTPALLDFDDRNTFSAWAISSIKFMRARNIIDGKGNNIFDSKGNATREQALKIAVKMVTVMTDPDFAPPTARLVDVQNGMALYTWDEGEKSIIALYNPDGKAIQHFETQITSRVKAESPLLLLTDIPSWYAGHAGLWHIEGTELDKVSSLPAKDLTFVKAGAESSVPIILTWTDYENLDTIYRPADAIVTLKTDGNDTWLLSSADGHGISIEGLLACDSIVEFYSDIPIGMGHSDSYLYALLSAPCGVPANDGRLMISVESFIAGRPEVMDNFSFDAPEAYRQGYVDQEQQRLDNLGIGVK